MIIYCCICDEDISPRLTNGAEIYPHREDLKDLPFWKHDRCGGYVGCHHKTKNRTSPLGCIPSEEIKSSRKEIHKILDPIWRSGVISRSKLYRKISELVGWNYHTAMIKSVIEARDVYKAVKHIQGQLSDD